MVFTEEQQKVIDKLNELKVNFTIVFLFTDGKRDRPYFVCHDSKQYRKQLLEVFHVIYKQAYDGSQYSSFKAYDMDINLYNWDTCKIVGTRQVTKKIPVGFRDEIVIEQITNCDIRSGKVKEGEYTPVAEQADA